MIHDAAIFWKHPQLVCSCFRRWLLVTYFLRFRSFVWFARYALGLSAARSGLANNNFDVLTRIIRAESLDPSATLCSYALHGRCATPFCRDMHLDVSDDPLDVEAFFKSRFVPRKPFSVDMFYQAVTAALTVHTRRLRDGLTEEESLRVVVVSLLPLCRPKLD